MAAGTTYEPIVTNTLGSAVANVTLSSIPSTYTDLILVCNLITTTRIDTHLQVNGDTANNYSYTFIYGEGVGGGTTNYYTTQPHFYIGEGGTRSTNIIHLNNYKNTTTYKTFLARSAYPADGSGSSVGLWRSTSAINAIKILRNTGTFSVGSTFTLYGIASA
jgi:hypothetical protein